MIDTFNAAKAIGRLGERCLKQLHRRVPKAMACVPGFGDDTKQRILSVMEYTLYAKSKLMRPILLYVLGESLGVALAKLDAVACAIELMHTFSLIHDDLPAMDNDNTRRGCLCSHLKFDEAAAILAGDGLALVATLVIAQDTRLSSTLKLENVALLNQHGLVMIEGQWWDTHCHSVDKTKLDYINKLKTAALISFIWESVAIIANLSTAQRKLLKSAAYHMGLAFQIQDDLQDCSNGAEHKQQTGYPEVIGISRSVVVFNEHCRRLISILCKSELSSDGVFRVLSVIAEFISCEVLAKYLSSAGQLV